MEKFSYVTDENKYEGPVTRGEVNATFEMIFEYKLDIRVINGTDCDVEVEDSDEERGDYVDLRNSSQKCRHYFVENHKNPWCFDQWFVNKISKTLYRLRFFTTNSSLLPKEGRYQLSLNNGE